MEDWLEARRNGTLVSCTISACTHDCSSVRLPFTLSAHDDSSAWGVGKS